MGLNHATCMADTQWLWLLSATQGVMWLNWQDSRWKLGPSLQQILWGILPQALRRQTPSSPHPWPYPRLFWLWVAHKPYKHQSTSPGTWLLLQPLSTIGNSSVRWAQRWRTLKGLKALILQYTCLRNEGHSHHGNKRCQTMMSHLSPQW